jgi:adenylylsulfate kinase
MSELKSVLLTGTIGSGKTAVAEEIGEVLGSAGIRAAIIDLDWLCWITLEPENIGYDALALANLKAMLPKLERADVTHLVLARAMLSRSTLEAFADALPRLEVIRLDASPATITKRLERRDSGSVLKQHLVESVEMSATLDATGGESARIDNDDRPLREVANEVLAHLGWVPR